MVKTVASYFIKTSIPTIMHAIATVDIMDPVSPLKGINAIANPIPIKQI
jgi:hypothetical protein